MHVDPVELSILAGAIVPLLVGLVTKLKASSGVKSIMLVALSAVGAVVAQVVAASGDFTVKRLLVSFAEVFVVAVATHYGVYKPTGVSGSVQTKTAEFGVGAPK